MLKPIINETLKALGFSPLGSRSPEPVDSASQITQTESAFRDRSIDSQKINFVGGIMNFGKTSFNDDTDPGYYISSQGIYFGNGEGSNETFLKYAVATGLFQLYGEADIQLFDGGSIRIDNPASGSTLTPFILLNRAAGPAMDITNEASGIPGVSIASEGPAVDLIGGNGSDAVAELTQTVPVSTNFSRMQRFWNANFTASITHWLADNDDPNGTLTADSAGDICYSTNGNMYIAQGGTTWLTVTAA